MSIQRVELARLGGPNSVTPLATSTDGKLQTESVAANVVATQTAVIANGASVSGEVTLTTGRLVGIDMPAAWTAANITIQVTRDGTNWLDLFDSFGQEYVIQAAASRSIAIPYIDMLGIQRFRFRSGTAATPVNQGAERTLTLRVLN